ncbi:MAG: hypothetical protein H0T59_06530 [Chloroflexi bacterium]|nr:hypothetical protein [Chloroflexota bacterium]
MKFQVIDCVGCGEAVPYGRLSCPACGALLASVAGVSRTPEQTAASRWPPMATTEATTEALPGSAEALPAEPALSGAETLSREPETASPPPAPRPDVERRPDPLAGAYRPPVATLAGAGAATATWMRQVTTRTVERARSGQGPADGADAAVSPDAVDSVDRALDVAGGFVTVGAAIAILGFLLPWARFVTGSAGGGGYFGSWGLASPTHLIVLAGLLAILAVGVVRTRVPAWLASGALATSLGGLVVGLTWPYLVGSGVGMGVTFAALGGVAMVIGGIAGAWATRRAGPARTT